ncbi:MAG TPA: LysR family transcriptional regulator [Gemmatimonadales bacterium]|nr:LysR family transcriptional regulator [Gemmatimonadales bacterium]
MDDAQDSAVTLRHLRLLVALAEARSVTAAARAVGISQPALSQNLRAIERHYGFPLLMRSGRRVVLTQPARRVVDYARRILRLVGESEQAARDLVELKTGSLSVAGGATAATYLLPRSLAEFRARHADIGLHLRMGDVRGIERWVLAGDVDLGVIGEVSQPLAVVVTPFDRDELVVAVAPTHPLASVARLDGETLADYPLIVRERGSSTRETLERAMSRAGFALRVQFELESPEAILQAVAAGLGASVVSTLAVADTSLGRRIRTRRVAGLNLDRYLAVVTHPDAEPGPAAREFIALLARGGTPPAIPAA